MFVGPPSCGGAYLERPDVALGSRPSKLRLLLSFVVACSGLSVCHVQEFASSGSEPATCSKIAGKAGIASSGSEPATCPRTAGKAGIASSGREPAACTDPTGKGGIGIQRNSNGRRERVGNPQPRFAPGSASVCYRRQGFKLWRSACPTKASATAGSSADHERYDTRGPGVASGIGAAGDRVRGAGKAERRRGAFAGGGRPPKGTSRRRRGSSSADRRKSLRKSRFTAAHQGGVYHTTTSRGGTWCEQ